MQKLKDYLYSDENFRPRKYSIEQIRRFLENPQTYERQLREVSQYLLIVSSKYFRLIDYFSKMLTLDYIIVPIGITEEEMNSDKFKKNYLKVVNYMEQFNVKHEIRKILEVILSEDIFFGYERNQGTDEFMIQRLPTNYCKLYSIERGVLNFAFNFSYFDTRKKELENYPSEFSEMYSEYIETGNNWMVLDGNKSVCFKLRETYPIASCF